MVAKKKSIKKGVVNLVHLYPKELNIYGDDGNLLVLQRRLEWRGYKVKIHKVGIGDKLPAEVDILVAGGGQDVGQLEVESDLKKKSSTLNSLAKSGVAMLAICGSYQLFGRHYLMSNNRILKGVGLFDAYTEASNKRLIGNVVIETPLGRVVGFENHSGQTYLGAGQLYLGQVIKGCGNNNSDHSEGALKNNVFGSYLHGPLLPKNPHLADEIIRRALTTKFGSVELTPLNDKLEQLALAVASNRPK